MCVHAVWFGDRTHKPGFEERCPFIGETPQPTYIILKHNRMLSNQTTVRKKTKRLSNMAMRHFQLIIIHTLDLTAVQDNTQDHRLTQVSFANYENKQVNHIPLVRLAQRRLFCYTSYSGVTNKGKEKRGKRKPLQKEKYKIGNAKSSDIKWCFCITIQVLY